jgi:hypothetical protein
MVEHTVWFKMADGTGAEERAQLLAGLRALPAAIPEIVSLACGEDFSGRSRGFEVGLVTRFEDRAGLEIYGPHPAHKAFIDAHKHLWSEVQALDFED